MTDNYVVLTGTKGGPAIRPGSSMPTSNLLALNGQAIVVDCGLGVTRGLVDQGMQLKDLALIFVTHLHSDHYMELGPLLHTAWTAGLSTTVTIYGPQGLDIYWQGFVKSMQSDIELRIEDEGRPDLRELVHIHALDEGAVLDHHGVRVSALRVQHPPLVECFGLSFKSGDAHVVFSGDTAPIDAMVDFASNADLLIHEAMLEEALPALMKRVGNGSEKMMQHWLRSHTFAHDAGAIATRAGVKALALSHLIPSDDDAYDERHWKDAVSETWTGPLFIGRDGLKIDLPGGTPQQGQSG